MAAASPPSRQLTDYLHCLAFADLPGEVVHQASALFLDWLGSAVAGAEALPVRVLGDFRRAMGPADGPAQCFDDGGGSSAYFAALVNAAASHVVEQDDVHNGSVFHPATVVFPPLLAASQWRGPVHGRDFIVAAVAGYETGIRVGEYLGRSHYRVFHTTGTAGTLAAAMAVGRLLALPADSLRHALGTAGTQAAGLWEFLRSAAHSKQLHTAKAAADGMLAAWTAAGGLTGAEAILEGEQGMAAGMLGEGNPQAMQRLGERFTMLETSFKYHASCRHTHPAADALLALVTEHDLAATDIASIEAHVYQAAMDVLGPVRDPRSVHQAKFSMGFVLALIAARRSAMVADFTDDALDDPVLRGLHDKVHMVVDADIDAAYPACWSARVILTTVDGRRLAHKVTVPRGDPGNALSDAELNDKFRRLAERRLAPATIDAMIERAWALPSLEDVGAAFRLPTPG